MKNRAFSFILVVLSMCQLSCMSDKKGKIEMPGEAVGSTSGIQSSANESGGHACLDADNIYEDKDVVLPRKGAVYKDLDPSLGNDPLFEMEAQLDSFLIVYEKTTNPSKDMYKEALVLLDYAMFEYMKKAEECRESGDDYRKSIMWNYVRRLYAHCLDLSVMGGVTSTDHQAHFKNFMANTQTVFNIIAYRKGKGYEAEILTERFFMHGYDRFNRLEISGKIYYLLNIDIAYSSVPILFEMVKGKPVEMKISDSAELWDKLYDEKGKNTHLDFNPRSWVWTQCQKGMNGTWQPIPGKVRIQLKQAGGRWSWNEFVGQ